MTTLRTWCAAMENAPRCMITLSNLAYDAVKYKYVPREVMRKIVNRVVALWEKVPVTGMSSSDPEGAASLLSHTLDSAEETLFCRGSKVIVSELVSRIIDRGTLEEFYIRNTFLAKAIKPHVPGRPREIISLTTERLKPDATVRGRRPFAWITKASMIIDEERSLIEDKSSHALATRLRDYLGLDHLGARRELFEMLYPDRALDSARVAAPTFVEGACREVYRSNIDPIDGWGRAVNLGDKDHRDGGPEAVHTPVRLTAGFTFRHLGALDSRRVCSSVTLQGACPRPWQPPDVEELEKYIV